MRTVFNSPEDFFNHVMADENFDTYEAVVRDEPEQIMTVAGHPMTLETMFLLMANAGVLGMGPVNPSHN